MRIKLAFAAITVTVLSVVACNPDAPDNQPHPLPVHCATEDAPGPCVWDAEHQGDGSGLSFEVRADGSVRYLTEADLEALAETRR